MLGQVNPSSTQLVRMGDFTRIFKASKVPYRIAKYLYSVLSSYLDMVGVTSSILVPPTNQIKKLHLDDWREEEEKERK